MKLANTLTAAADGPPFMVERFRPNSGLRWGWGLLVFFSLCCGMPGVFVLLRAGGVRGLEDSYKNLSHITVTPALLGESEGISLAILCLAAKIMSGIERRKFGTYGLPLRQAFGRDFRIGLLAGFSAISGTLLVMFLLGGFRVTGFGVPESASGRRPSWSRVCSPRGMA